MNCSARFFTAAVLSMMLAADESGSASAPPEAQLEWVALPRPAAVSTMPVEEAIASRRSIRHYNPDPLADEVVSRLLWSAQGITEPQRGLRAAPSAGATYPLELYLVDHRGVFRYDPDRHALGQIASGDRRNALARAALGQQMIREAPVSLVIAAVEQRTASRYGQTRAQRYVHIEAGHAAQNIHLQAVALGLGSVPVGAFRDREVQKALLLPDEHEPLYIIPVGVAR